MRVGKRMRKGEGNNFTNISFTSTSPLLKDANPPTRVHTFLEGEKERERESTRERARGKERERDRYLEEGMAGKAAVVARGWHNNRKTEGGDAHCCSVSVLSSL